LDDVHILLRSGCVMAIKRFLDKHCVKLALCSCVEEYSTLATHLKLKDALVLKPLTCKQVEDYLQMVGPPLAGLRAALANAGDSLWELMKSPRMLSIVILTYQGRSVDTLRVHGTPEERQKQLFKDYVERMFERRPPIGRCYTKDESLAWLARAMRERDQSEFDLDRLQPDWLSNVAQRRLVILIPALLSLDLLSGLGRNGGGYTRSAL
jgi:hypothetical protein